MEACSGCDGNSGEASNYPGPRKASQKLTTEPSLKGKRGVSQGKQEQDKDIPGQGNSMSKG